MDGIVVNWPVHRIKWML